MKPSGQPATIKWLTVGGRTSAFVTELQKVQSSQFTRADKDDLREVIGGLLVIVLTL